MNNYGIKKTETGYWIVENNEPIGVEFKTEYEVQRAIDDMFPVDEKLLNFRRTICLDAYRRYQAAVNYGEFERSYEADQFIKRLYDKDWTALDYVPSQLKYFAGEVGYAGSGLIRRF